MPEEVRIVHGDDRFTLESDGRVLGFAEVFEGLRTDDRFGARLTEALRSSPAPAFFWECASVSRKSATSPFEFVLVISRPLATVQADPTPFASKLAGGTGPIRTFENLSGDARLVAPAEEGPRAAYAHLATFVREAPTVQVAALWRAVGAAAGSWLETRSEPLWLSTSGLGVHWLHVRLDASPKYYSHEPYRRRRVET